MPERPAHTEILPPLPDEPALLRLAAEGDAASFSKLYTYYYPRLYSSIAFVSGSHEDAQEIIHETFLKIWKAREGLILVRSFGDYSYVLAKNLFFNQLKRKKIGLKAIRSMSDLQFPDTGAAPDQDLLFKQYLQTALAAINQLPGQKKKIFLLRTQEGLSLDEIAAEMDIARPTVKKHLYAALAFVREYLRRHTETIGTLLILYFFKK